MTLYITLDKKLYDDDDGLAQAFPEWPKDAVIATQKQIDAIQNPPKTFEQVVAEFDAGVQAYLDNEAKSKGYDNIVSACSYAPAENPFQAEAITFVKWCGNVWAYCYGELAKVKAGKRAMPTIEQIISELPPL